MSSIALLRQSHGGLSQDEEREALRAAFIYEEQRIHIPNEKQVSPFEFARLGPLLSPLSKHLQDRSSESAFQLEQQLWTYLAGERTWYWRRDGGKQARPPADRPLYAPLDETRREIRVLQVSRVSTRDANTLRDDDGDESFKANLLHVSLDDDPPYIAVSYAWGDRSTVGRFESDQEGIAAFEFNRAVSEIVRTLVPMNSTLYLWIDALCINQLDDDEKGSQVALMGEVFKRARQVVVFLGEANEDTTTDMDLIHRSGPLLEFTSRESLELGWYDVDRLESESNKAGIPITSWCSVGSLASRKWFTRYWVIQEVALGTCPVVVCGKHAASWDLFTSVHNWIFQNWDGVTALSRRAHTLGGPPFYMRLSPGLAMSLMYIKSIRDRLQSENPLPIGLLVNDLGIFEATDPRDRIFAITGLTSPSDVGEEEFRPDYKMTVERLYTQVTRRLLSMEHGVRTLYRAGVGYSRSLGHLPSWVPDWTSTGASVKFYTLLPNKEVPPTQGAMLRVAFLPEHPEIAILHGRVVDSVSRLGPARDSFYSEEDRREERAQWLGPVLEIVREAQGSAQPPASGAHIGGAPAGAPGWKNRLLNTLLASPGSAAAPDALRGRAFDAYLDYMCQSIPEGATSDWPDWPREELLEVLEIDQASNLATSGRRFFVSSRGYFGLTAPGTQEGDLVCAFPGMITPVIIRPVEPEAPMSPSASTDYILVGDAYHEGIIQGDLEVEHDLMGPIRLI